MLQLVVPASKMHVFIRFLVKPETWRFCKARRFLYISVEAAARPKT